MQEETDIRDLSSQGLNRGNTTKSGRCSDIEQMTCIGHAEYPARNRTTTEIHDGVDIAFDQTIGVLSLVLVLMVGLRLILGDEKTPYEFLDLIWVDGRAQTHIGR